MAKPLDGLPDSQPQPGAQTQAVTKGSPTVEISHLTIRRNGGARHDCALQIRLKNEGPQTIHSLRLVLDLPKPVEFTIPHRFMRDTAPDGKSVRVYWKNTEPFFPGELIDLMACELHAFQYSIDDRTWDMIRERKLTLRWTLYLDNHPAISGEKPMRELNNF